MKVKMVPKIAVAIVCCLSLISTLSHAATVSYYTTGSFSNPTNGASLVGGGSGIKLGSGLNTVTLNFAGIASLAVPQVAGLPSIDNPLAVFSLAVTGTGVALSALDVADFSLTLHQVAPPGGGGSGGDVTVTGNIKAVASPGHFNIKFVPNPIHVPSFPQVEYTMTNLNASSQLEITSNPTTLYADIAAVPLPAAAWGGMALLGLLGAPKLRRLGSRSDVI